MRMLRRNGDSGHPWLIPKYCGWNEDACPSQFTLKTRLQYISLIIPVIFAFSPNLERALHKASGEMASNAFAQSNAKIIKHSFFDSSALSIILRIMNNASVVPYADLNPNCVFLIRFSASAFFSHERITAAKIL